MTADSVLKNVDDVAAVIASLKDSGNAAGIRDTLVSAVIYLRSEQQLKGSRTESIAQLEISIKEYLCFPEANRFNIAGKS